MYHHLSLGWYITSHCRLKGIRLICYIAGCTILGINDGEGNGTPLQYSCLETPMDWGAWWGAVHRVAKSLTRLNDFTLTFQFHASEREMATHSSVLAWGVQGTGEPGGLPSMGSHRVRHDWSDLAVAIVEINEKKKKSQIAFTVLWVNQ